MLRDLSHTACGEGNPAGAEQTLLSGRGVAERPGAWSHQHGTGEKNAQRELQRSAKDPLRPSAEYSWHTHQKKLPEAAERTMAGFQPTALALT